MNWFLNIEKKLYPAAPASAIIHTGNGVNIIFVDTDNDLVIVARWIENSKINEFLEKIYSAIEK
jgi:hypothetical protein